MTTNRLWVPVLVGLLAAVLLSLPGSDQEAAMAVEPRAVAGKIMIPATAFIPITDDEDYTHWGSSLYMTSGSGTFTTPLWFPVPVVNITRITLYAYDNATPGTACVFLMLAQPQLSLEEPVAAKVCTGNSTAHPQVVATTNIVPSRVDTKVVGPYLSVSLGPGTTLYGVRVFYGY